MRANVCFSSICHQCLLFKIQLSLYFWKVSSYSFHREMVFCLIIFIPLYKHRTFFAYLGEKFMIVNKLFTFCRITKGVLSDTKNGKIRVCLVLIENPDATLKETTMLDYTPAPLLCRIKFKMAGKGGLLIGISPEGCERCEIGVDKIMPRCTTCECNFKHIDEVENRFAGWHKRIWEVRNDYFAYLSVN